jgi:hypothetical protein
MCSVEKSLMEVPQGSLPVLALVYSDELGTRTRRWASGRDSRLEVHDCCINNEVCNIARTLYQRTFDVMTYHSPSHINHQSAIIASTRAKMDDAPNGLLELPDVAVAPALASLPSP